MTTKTVFDLSDAKAPAADLDFLLLAQSNTIKRITFVDLLNRAVTVTNLTATGAASFTEVQQTGLATTRQPAVATQSTTATLTLAQIQARILTSNPAAAITLTFPTGATLDGYIANFANDTGFDFTIVNTSANAVTVAANTGTTYTGNATVAATSSASFRFRRVSTGSYQVFRI